jgi:hypothetical protein
VSKLPDRCELQLGDGILAGGGPRPVEPVTVARCPQRPLNNGSHRAYTLRDLGRSRGEALEAGEMDFDDDAPPGPDVARA